MDLDNIKIKIANTEEEFQQIHRLNYETFSEEIEQHSKNKSRNLIDVFDGENIYYIAKNNEQVIGMIALRDKRPFSLDKKIPSLNDILPPHKNPVEIRLLSIKKNYRNTKLFFLLLQRILKDNPENSYDMAVISGILSQIKLYKHIGFKEMGTLVGDKVKFQPMYLSKDNFLKFVEQINLRENKTINLLPGPVEIAANVKDVFCKNPISHRAEDFKTIFDRTRSQLCKITSAKSVEILSGTGTTANDAIAGQLSLLNQKGLIISNGEFGERLFTHSTNFNLEFSKIINEWGTPFDEFKIEQKIINSAAKWLWFVHHETSTGMLNDFDMISRICKKHNVKMCVDIISSLGTHHIKLSDTYLASAVSSKGLASYSGLAMVFYNHKLIKQNIPSNINLHKFSQANGIPFTLSSNLLFALDQSLQNFKNIDNRINKIRTIAKKTHNELEKMGVKTLVSKESSSNSTITIVLDEKTNSIEFGNKLKKNNIHISYESSYLVEKNWVQICFMGANPRYRDVRGFMDYL